MVLKPYPKYRDADLPWLDEMPAHWEEKRAKFFFREVDERSETGTEELLSVSHLTGVTPRSQKNVTMFKAESYVGHKLCRSGDLAVNTMWAWMAALGVAKQTGIVSPAYGVYRPHDPRTFDPEYLDYLLRTKSYVTEYYCRSTGIRTSRLRLYPDELLDIPVIRPPREEQEIMVAYLHAKDRQIARLIRTKQQLIDLLNEQKQAIIQRSVTRGLDPDAPTKSTGLDWLSEVPEHWETRKLKYLARFHNGLAFKPVDWKDSGVPIIRIQNLNGSGEFNYTDRSDLPERLLIHPGDMMFSWSGNRGTSFGPFIWDRAFPAYLNQHIFKIEGYSLNKLYFYYALRTVTKHIEEQSHGIIGLVHVTKPELGAISIPIPPPDDQVKIVDYIEEETKTINMAVQRAQREISLIREYRTRLISDVVTGKLDVRGAELPEPDMGDESIEMSLDGLESVVVEESPDTEEVTSADL